MNAACPTDLIQRSESKWIELLDADADADRCSKTKTELKTCHETEIHRMLMQWAVGKVNQEKTKKVHEYEEKGV